MTPRFKRARSERGAELIEFALVLPLLLFIVLGIVDFGFLFQRLEVVTNAAREGARIAVLPSYTTADVDSRVRSYMNAAGVPDAYNNTILSVNTTTPSVTLPSGTSIEVRTVGVTYFHDYLFLGPIAGWFGGSFGSVPLSGSATMRVEAGS